MPELVSPFKGPVILEKKPFRVNSIRRLIIKKEYKNNSFKRLFMLMYMSRRISVDKRVGPLRTGVRTAG